jgi:hypothetical protein
VGPTREVLFFQNIGALVMRFRKHIRGRLCRNCINDHFARTTLITSFLGWWGIISCILTPFLLLNNLFRYLSCLSLQPPPDQPSRGTGLALVAMGVACGAMVALGLIFWNVIHDTGPTVR